MIGGTASGVSQDMGLLGDVGERWLCLLTQWEGFIHHSELWSSVLDQLASGLVRVHQENIHKISRLTA